MKTCDDHKKCEQLYNLIHSMDLNDIATTFCLMKTRQLEILKETIEIILEEKR